MPDISILDSRIRTAAAIALSDVLDGIIKKPDRNRSLIVAIPRGGVVTADTISERLSIKNFDIVISKKLTDPDNKEQAIGAVIEDQLYVDFRRLS